VVTIKEKPLMPVYATYAVQLLLVIHVLKTGRDRYWIWLLLFLPLVGGAAYLIMEVLPDFFGSLTGQRARRGVKQLLDPAGDLRACAAAWEQSPNAENGRRYAQALLDSGRATESREILSKALDGFFRDDPALLLLKAKAEFELGNFREAVGSLDQLKESNPDHRSPDGHLLYARALEAIDQTDKSIEEYQAVATYYPGAEARFRYATAMKNAGLDSEAKSEFESILRDAGLAPAHFRKSQKQWLKASEDALKTF